MLTAGVDLSAAKERTAAVEVEWGLDCATVAEPRLGLGDEELVGCLGRAGWVGIDAPFGWPLAMAAAVYEYSTGDRWSGPDKEAFRYRRTDVFVQKVVREQTSKKLWPLSVSSDRIGLTAWRAAQLREHAFERSGLRFDRAGADRVVEVYPAAALMLWGIERGGYKGSGAGEGATAAVQAREALIAVLEERASWLRFAAGARDVCVESDDALDAVLAALVARAAAVGCTLLADGEDAETARVEGWVHLPKKGSLQGLLGGT